MKKLLLIIPMFFMLVGCVSYDEATKEDAYYIKMRPKDSKVIKCKLWQEDTYGYSGETIRCVEWEE